MSEFWEVKHIERFWSYVEKTKDCWMWRGGIQIGGYGKFSVRNGDKVKTNTAHIISFKLSGGIIPKGKELDHLCRNPSCVNPKHLEAVTHKENSRRMIKNQQMREDGRIEWTCEHGIGHTIDAPKSYKRKVGKYWSSHGCDGCCSL